LLDDHFKLGESIVLETMKEFVSTVISVYGNKYLHPPSSNEVEHILRPNKARGFSEMIDSTQLFFTFEIIVKHIKNIECSKGRDA
jgi:hypothetical protein